MSKVLFLSIPSHGHMNPTLGLAAELARQGEEVTFFSSAEFKYAVENSGAQFKCYSGDLNIFQKKEKSPADPQKTGSGFIRALFEPDKFIGDVLAQIADVKFDYVVLSAAYPFARVIAEILEIPTISSYAVFATLKDIFIRRIGNIKVNFHFLFKCFRPLFNLYFYRQYKKVRRGIREKYGVKISGDVLDQFLFKGDLNIVYTSEFFIAHPENYDYSFIFIGPPVYAKKDHTDFPLQRLQGRTVIYISLGTIFSNHSVDLNRLFFECFGNMDAIIVMAAHQVDLSTYDVPDNFIIRDFVPQLEVLKYTTVAITHAGMNSIGDILYHNIPFVAIPLGADQFYLANRAQDLGATIVLDGKTLTAKALKNAVKSVLREPEYLENIHKISTSFKAAGGYKKAVDEIFKLKKAKSIST